MKGRKGYRYRLSIECESRMVAEYQSGARVADLIQRYGISKPGIYHILHRCGVEMRGSVPKAQRPKLASVPRPAVIPKREAPKDPVAPRAYIAPATTAPPTRIVLPPSKDRPRGVRPFVSQ